jgi:hypothetical protein
MLWSTEYPNCHLLRYFWTAAKEGGLTKAAARVRLHVSQPTIVRKSKGSRSVRFTQSSEIPPPQTVTKLKEILMEQPRDLRTLKKRYRAGTSRTIRPGFPISSSAR